MQTYLKTRPVWIQLLLFIGMAFGIFTVLSLIGVSILSKTTGISVFDMSNTANWNSHNPGMIVFVRGMLLVQFLGLFVIPSLLFAYFSDPQPMHYMGFKPPVKPIYWVLAVIVMFLAIPLVEYTGILNRQVHFGKGLQSMMQSMEDEAAKQIKFMLSGTNIGNLILNIIFIALFAGVGEELFFRGVLQRLLIRATKNPWTGIIIAAFLFSFFHFQFFGFVPRFLLGILLGAIYWYSGSIWPAMLAHFAYDGFFIVLAYFRPQIMDDTNATLFDTTSAMALSALVSAVVVVALVWLMKRNSTITYADTYKNDFLDVNDPNF
jgi:membrane protease YdiL (CAAX protease family)